MKIMVSATLVGVAIILATCGYLVDNWFRRKFNCGNWLTVYLYGAGLTCIALAGSLG